MKRFILAALIGIFAVAAAACDEAVQPAATTGQTAETASEETTAGIVSGRAERMTIDDEEDSEAEPTSVPADDPMQEVTGDLVPVETAAPSPAESFSYNDSNAITVTYYDMEEQREVSTQYPVDDSKDPLEVVDGVTSTLASVLGNDRIEVQSTTFSDGNLFVDFSPTVYDLGLTSADEHQVLDSIADTYLANVEGIKAVFFTVDGDPFSSEHTQMMPGEAYRTVAG